MVYGIFLGVRLGWVFGRVSEMNIDEIIDKLIELKDVWYATENVSGDVVWGECARDIER